MTVMACAALAAGCSRRLAVEPGADAPAVAGVAVPLDVRQFEVVNADGYRGVFLKLSRLPDAVNHFSENDPARIVLEVKGPPGEDAAEESYPGQDALVSQFRVSREFGTLRIVLDLQGTDPPPYSVHPMADWIMIRLGPVEAQEPAGGADTPGRG